ncbi:MAG: hypothetical protein NTW25_14650 [Candidatus Kapabacteria bacterium]|nr:hypothetical protein [Candidatus Kapabacteria bacterium]
MEKKDKDILDALKAFCLNDKLTINSDMFSPDNENKFEYYPVNEYLSHITSGVKPETATSILFRHLLTDLKVGKISEEVNLNNSFIDFIIKETGISNPICIELKPLYRIDKKKNTLSKIDFTYTNHKEQIQKYLTNQRVEYVVLTNIDKAFIFNKNAIFDFKPSFETTFAQIFEDYLVYGNLWNTIKRFDDQIKFHSLDDEFFKDLKNWHNELIKVNYKPDNILSNEEIIVLFLNKFIFIRTLEDYGLIPYRYIQETYQNIESFWSPKGYNIVFKRFFDTIEDFFEMYYDTELFTSNFWNFVEESENNIRQFKTVFEIILGLDSWSTSFGKGLVHYNYRQIDEDIFGKAYETWIAQNRKDEGIYYTPTTITEYMTDKIVDTLFDEPINLLLAELKSSNPNIEHIEQLKSRIYSIKIIDSTSGSGSFIIKVLRAVYKKYQLINDATKWATKFSSDDLFNEPENITFAREFRKSMNFNEGSELIFISSIILNHIFAADKDERAIDTAKTNIWKEAVKLNPQVYQFLKLDNTKLHILPNLAMNFIAGDSLTDFDFDKQIDIIENEFQNEIIELFVIRNKYLTDPYNPSVIKNALIIKEKIKKRLLSVQDSNFQDALFFPLQFFFCFFSADGKALPKEKRGFDGIISNPPWEAIKPVKKEFAKLRKNELDILDFDKWFESKLEKDSKFKSDWDTYKEYYSTYSNYVYSKYKHQSNGDPNFFKFFLERDFELIKSNGLYCLLVPSGIQTDEGSNKLRELIILENTLMELSSFENRGYFKANDKNKNKEKLHKIKLFPDVDSRFKFSIVLAKKEKSDDYTFKSKFYLTDPNELYNNKFIEYNLEKIKQFSPKNISIMEFKTEIDYELCLKILGNNPLFTDLSYVLRSELHMTNNSILFKDVNKTKKTKNLLELYEGKMIHQFQSRFSTCRYILDEKETRDVLMSKVIFRIKANNHLSNDEVSKLTNIENLLVDYQTYRLVYRAIASSTNERTLISSIIPQNVFIGHSMNYLVNVEYDINDTVINVNKIHYSEVVFLMCLFNSLTLNYYIRNKVSANLTMNFINELPIAEANEEDKMKIVKLGFSLLYTTSNRNKEYDDLKNSLGVEIDKRSLEEIRADLEIIIAKHLYKLELSDWEHLTSTFTYGDGDSKRELDDFIRISKEKWELV